MAKGDKHIEFLKDFSVHKKGADVILSRDLSNMLIGLKVAKVYKAKKVKSKKKD